MAGIVIAVNAGYGYFRMQYISENLREYATIAMVQGDVSQVDKWDSQKEQKIAAKYRTLTRKINLKQGLIIWPETAIPFFLESERDIIKQDILSGIVTEGVYLLSGIVRDKDFRFYNAGVLFNAQQSLIGVYHKIKIVPFGEYTPFLFKRIVSIIPELTMLEDFSKGEEMIPFRINLGKEDISFGVLICFENLYPHLAAQWKERDIDFLVVLSNDAWFQVSAEPEQHLYASILRAIENRISIFQCTNTGITASVDPVGRVFDILRDGDGNSLFIEGVLITHIRRMQSSSLHPLYPLFFACHDIQLWYNQFDYFHLLS